LIAEAKDNLVRLIEKQMVDHIRNRWEKYVDSMDNSDDPRNMILDVVCNANWAESKIRITNKMEHLRLLVLFTVDLDIDDDCNPKEVLVEGRVSPSIAVGVDDNLSPAQAEFRPCGQSLFGSVAVDMTVKP
jgi:hypothetical protein